jgi:3-oxoadipate enol-lactonase
MEVSFSEEKIENLDLKYADQQRAKLPNGLEVYYEIYGNLHGPTITIVNNFFLISPLWKNFTKELAKSYRIMTYDLRNQGATSMVEGDIEFSSLIEDLNELLNYLNIERTSLVGTSTSTLICRDFALKYPEKVEGLALVGPLFCPYGSRRRKFLTKSWINSLENGGAENLFAHIYPLIYGDMTIENGGSAAYLALKERFVAINSEDQIKRFLKSSLTTEDTPDKLQKIHAPTLLMAGEADFINCRTSLEASAKLMPHAIVKEIEYCGHIPYFESNYLFELHIGEFVKSITNA